MKKQLLKITFLLATAVHAQVSFEPPVNFATDIHPQSVFSADFNGDGKMDLATCNIDNSNVSVLLGSGTGTFSTAVNYSVNLTPSSLCSADLNGDGNMDLATANYGGSNVSVLLGNGTGIFATAVDYGVGAPNPYYIISADLNGDGSMDLATANSAVSGDVSVLINNGNATFATAVNYAVGNDPHSLFSADFNGDGKMDLVAANFNGSNVSVLINNGNGTFAAAVNYTVGANPASVFSADFNGDGSMDLVTAGFSSGNVSVLLGSGGGIFASAVNYSTSNLAGANSVYSDDFNGDGKMDLVTSHSGNGTISVLLGIGTGAFTSALHYGVGAAPFSVFSADFNGDNKMDLVTSNYSDNNVSVLLNNYSPVPAATLNFDGVDDYVELPYFPPTANLTVEFNIKTTGPDQYGDILAWAGNTGNTLEILTNGSNGNLVFGYYDGTNWTADTSSLTINDGNWHHVAIVRDSATSMATFYIDGFMAGTDSFPIAVLPSDVLTIGAENWLGSIDYGRVMTSSNIDELRIWNRALCKGEILNNKNAELHLPQTGLIAYYRFNQGLDNGANSAVTTLTDSSGNANTGTLNNFALIGTNSNWEPQGAVVSDSTGASYTPLSFSGGITNVSCNGYNNGLINLSPSGGSLPYTFAWSNGASSEDVSGLAPGNYSVTITDVNACSTTLTATITEPAALNITTTTAGETITANATGVSYQWIDCGNSNAAISGETNQSFTATINGNYAVVITLGLCSDTSACVAITTVGIKNSTTKGNVSIYPNPTSGTFIVSGFETGTKLEVVNVMGEVVYTGVTTGTKTKIDLSNQSNGVYFIKTSNGLLLKIIKQE